MKNISAKKVFIGERQVFTDWRNTKIVTPENFEKKIEVNEIAKKEAAKQKIEPQNNRDEFGTRM